MSVINSAGSSLLFSTYLGGDGDDFFQTISIDPTNGNVYLGFHTDSSNFPSANAALNTAIRSQASAAGPSRGILRLDAV